MPPRRQSSPRVIALNTYLQRLIWLCVVPMAVVSAGLAADALRREHAQRSDELQRLATRAQSTLEGDLLRRTQGLQALARSASADDYRQPDLPALHVHALAYANAFNTPVTLGDSVRTMWLSTRAPLGTPLPKMNDPIGYQAVERAMKINATSTGNLFIGAVSRKPVVVIATPVGAPAGRSGPIQWPAAWLAIVEASAFDRLLADIPRDAGWHLVLLDGNGRAITADSLPPDVLGQPERAHHRAQSVANTPWTLVVHAEPWAFYAPHLRIGGMLLTGLLLMLGLAALTARYGARQLGRAVQRLSRLPSVPARDAPANEPTLRIAEIESARAELELLDAQRQEAEQQKQITQAQHVAEMEAALQSLGRSEARMRAIFDGASEGVAIISDDVRILRCNPVFAEMLLGTVQSLRHTPLLDNAPPEQRKRHLDIFDQLRREADASGRATYRGTVRLKRVHGEVVFETYLACMRWNAELLYVLLARDVTDSLAQRKRLSQTLQQLSAAHAELRQLAAAQRDIEERERRRMARELHDGLQQELGAVQMKLDLLAQQLDAAQRRLATEARDATAAAIESLRRVVRDLRPRTLDELGLSAALQQLTDETAALSGLQAELELVGDAAVLDAWPETVTSCAYRLIQECLTNVRKHAAASFVLVLVDATRPGTLVLQVSDDGRGITDDDLRKDGAFGMRGMLERVAPLRGSVRIERGHGSDRSVGTTITVELPRPDIAASAALAIEQVR